MKQLYISMLILVLLAITIVGLMHIATYQNYTMFLTVFDPVEKGEIESHRYLQFSSEPGVLLWGYSHSLKITDIQRRRISFRFESITQREIESVKSYKKTKEGSTEMKYKFGVYHQIAGDPNSNFYGSYVFTKIWVLELVLFFALVLILLGLYKTKRKPEPADAVNEI